MHTPKGGAVLYIAIYSFQKSEYYKWSLEYYENIGETKFCGQWYFFCFAEWA